MKFVSITLLFHYWLLNSYTTADSDSCMDQSRLYKSDTDKNIWKKFKNEFSIIGNVKKNVKKWIGRKDASYAIKNDMKQYLCACALFKYNQKTVNGSFEDIFKATKDEPATIGVHISYFVFDYTHKFPAIYCKSGSDTLVIARGPKQQSLQKPVYNIYVGTISEDDKYFEFKGTIDNVDVETKEISSIEVA